jgi:minor histocompatibility antigen H13
MSLDSTIYLAYVALGMGAVLPIYFGSFGSLKGLDKAEAKAKSHAHEDGYHSEDSEDDSESESLSAEDAMWFPVMGSGVLFGLYLLFNYFSKEYINYLLTAYFALLGAGALTKTLTNVAKLTGITAAVGALNEKFHLRMFQKGKGLVFKLNFDYVTGVSLALAVMFTAYYVVTKNWIASNVYGEAFATSAIQLLSLDDFKTGMVLLSGLFLYDIFWVFGTDVMVTVAKNFDAPVKILFPKNLFADELQFTMLGLGDIVIPGIFVALCLRFDQYLAHSKNKGKKGASKGFAKPYFTACFIAYGLGLVTTVVVMHTFKAAQVIRFLLKISF